jgi:Sulfotransferase family
MWFVHLTTIGSAAPGAGLVRRSTAVVAAIAPTGFVHAWRHAGSPQLVAVLPDRTSAIAAEVALRSAVGVEVRSTVARLTPECIVRPVVIVSAPRAGSTLLAETLRELPEIWTIGGESHQLIESAPRLRPDARGFASNRLVAEDLIPKLRDRLLARFLAGMRDRLRRPYVKHRLGSPARLLEKTPRNALRVSFLNALFPDALFVLLVRDPRPNVSSIMEAWQAGERFVNLRQLPGWEAGEAWAPGEWKLLLTPGWKDLRTPSLADVAAMQWSEANEIAIRDLQEIPAERKCSVDYDDLVADPLTTLDRICAFARLGADAEFRARLAGGLAQSTATVTPPSAGKWKKNERAMAPRMESLLAQWARLQAVHAEWKDGWSAAAGLGGRGGGA